MENDKNGNYSQKESNPQHENKRYPGYAPDPSSGSPTDEFIDTDPNHLSDEVAARLAEKGPVRNSNYHNIDEEDNSINNSGQEKNSKTLEDFNDTNPQRDINKLKGST